MSRIFIKENGTISIEMGRVLPISRMGHSSLAIGQRISSMAEHLFLPHSGPCSVLILLLANLTAGFWPCIVIKLLLLTCTFKTKSMVLGSYTRVPSSSGYAQQ